MKNRTLVFLLSFSIGAAAAAAQPKLKVVEGLKINLGRIDRGKLATRQLTLKNIGNQKLNLGNVEVSCGCTGTVISKKELKPGDTTSLLITFNSSGFIGPVHKSLTISSNSADAPSTVVDLSAIVIEDLSFSPAWFYFKDTEAGHKSTAVVKLKNESTKDLMITGFRTQLPRFMLKYPKKPFAPGSTLDLTAEFTPEDAMPVLGDGVFVTTSSQTQPELYIRVIRSVKKLK
ncbi:MAG TPA: hypothetical protein DGH68_04505 [Bacteroidetes bacterium]|nr:hypothetical protein [Bacteroidota bacterium]